MAFWGVVISQELPFKTRITGRKFCLTRATLLECSSSSTVDKSSVYISVGSLPTVMLCCLTKKYNTTLLELHFEENEQITFSVQGPGEFHLIGYLYSNISGNETRKSPYGDHRLSLVQHQLVDDETRKFIKKFILFVRRNHAEFLVTEKSATNGVGFIVADVGTVCYFSVSPRVPSGGEIENKSTMSCQGGVTIKELVDGHKSEGIVVDDIGSTKKNLAGKSVDKTEGHVGKGLIMKKEKKTKQLKEEEVVEVEKIEKSEEKVSKAKNVIEKGIEVKDQKTEHKEAKKKNELQSDDQQSNIKKKKRKENDVNDEPELVVENVKQKKKKMKN